MRRDGPAILVTWVGPVVRYLAANRAGCGASFDADAPILDDLSGTTAGTV